MGVCARRCALAVAVFAALGTHVQAAVNDSVNLQSGCVASKAVATISWDGQLTFTGSNSYTSTVKFKSHSPFDDSKVGVPNATGVTRTPNKAAHNCATASASGKCTYTYKIIEKSAAGKCKSPDPIVVVTK